MRNGAIDQFVKGAQSPAENIFAGHVQEPDNFSVIMLLDLDHVQQTIQDLTHAFPPHFLHTFAAKANPVRVGRVPFTPLVLNEFSDIFFLSECLLRLESMGWALSAPLVVSCYKHWPVE